MKILFSAALSLLVVTTYCAKKLPPTSPDRFAPGLSRVETVDRLHLRLKFSEPIDPNSLSKNDFAITADSTNLGILSVSSGEAPDNVLLLTEPQKAIPYELVGQAADTAHNVSRFKKIFTGSTRPDTTPPRITSIFPGLSAVRARKNFTIRLTFSEPLDTARAPVYTVLPAVLKNRLSLRWTAGETNLDFALADSVGPDTTVYFIVAPTLTDLGGNHLLTPGFTVFTTDTVLPAGTVGGTLKYGSKPVRNGFVLFYKTDETKAAAVSDFLGGFTVPLPPGEYRVKAFADTAGSGDVQLFIEIPSFNTESKNLDLELKPPEKPLRLNELLTQ
jgi:hypothetical protein